MLFGASGFCFGEIEFVVLFGERLVSKAHMGSNSAMVFESL